GGRRGHRRGRAGRRVLIREQLCDSSGLWWRGGGSGRAGRRGRRRRRLRAGQLPLERLGDPLTKTLADAVTWRVGEKSKKERERERVREREREKKKNILMRNLSYSLMLDALAACSAPLP